MVMKNVKHIAHCFICLLLCSCEGLIQVEHPATQLIRASVFENDLTATATVAGLYAGLTSQSGFSGISFVTSLSADDMRVGQVAEPFQFYNNSILPVNISVRSIWTEQYTGIYKANAIIEGLERSVHVTPELKNQLTGEAKFFRAFHHFYLVNLFGDVPYTTTTDYRINSQVKRMVVADVYEKLITDLLDAKTLLAEDYVHAQGARVRVNKWAASALLARAYLYREDWTHAEEQATTVINKNSLYDLPPLNQVFLKNSIETIWQLIPPYNQLYTTEGGVFIREIFNTDAAVISDTLFNSFETNDARKNYWIATRTMGANTWRYAFKYKENYNSGTGAEYSTVFRLAEQFLIRAEARAQQEKLTGADGAAADLNRLRNRAGLGNTTAITQQEMLAAIEQERRAELFTEWGHRWFDLKRTNRASVVLQPIKPDWQSTDILYPIPFSELQLNTNLKPQNNGY